MFILFYCLPYNTLYHLRDWLHGVERFALSECSLLHTYIKFFVSRQSHKNGLTDSIQIWHVVVTCFQGVPYFEVTLTQMHRIII